MVNTEDLQKAKFLYDKTDAETLLTQLKNVGVKAEIIGTLPSNHDIDILIDKSTIPSKTPIHWLKTKLGAFKIIRTDIGSVFIVSAIFGHIDVFFSKPSNNLRKITNPFSDLKKALDEFPSLHWLSYAEREILENWLTKVKDLFSVFLKDYKSQVHVPRKQLSGHVRIVCAANPSWDYCEHCYRTMRTQCPTGKLLFGVPEGQQLTNFSE